MIQIMFSQDDPALAGFSSQLLGAARTMRRAAGSVLFRSGQRPALAEGSSKAGYLVPGTKIQLAAELGVTPEALYRCLAALQAEGKLSVKAGRLAWRAD